MRASECLDEATDDGDGLELPVVVPAGDDHDDHPHDERKVVTDNVLVLERQAFTRQQQRVLSCKEFCRGVTRVSPFNGQSARNLSESRGSLNNLDSMIPDHR